MDGSPNVLEGVTYRPRFIDVEVVGVLKAGAPLLVRCVKPDAMEIAELLRTMPGDRPPVGAEAEGETGDTEQQLMLVAPAMIERWAGVPAGADRWILPAFSFADPPAEGLIDGRELTYLDRGNLGLALLQLGGYLGGAAQPGFLGQRGGSDRGD